MSSRKKALELIKARHRLCELLASFPHLWEEVPAGKKDELKSLCDAYLSHGVIHLSESEAPPGEALRSLIYTVLYSPEPLPDPKIVREEKALIGTLILFPHLVHQLELPTLFLPAIRATIVPTVEWFEGRYILPVLRKWAPSKPFDRDTDDVKAWVEDAREWDEWRKFLCRRLASEVPLSIPPFGEEREVWRKRDVDVDVAEVRGNEAEMKKKKARWGAWKEKVYVEGWDDIIRECLNLSSLDNLLPPAEEILREAERRWKA